MRNNLPIYLVLLTVLAGCQSATSPQTSSQKQQAQQQWESARADVLARLANDQYRNGNFDKCQVTLEEALRLEPKSSELHLLGARLAIEQGNLELAEQHLAVVKKFDAANAEADYLSGVVLQRWQQPKQALAAYTGAADKNPGELSYLMAQAETLVSLQRTPEAVALLMGKVPQFEHSAAIRDAAGQLLMQQGQSDQGVEMLRQACALDSEDSTIQEHLGFALLSAKRYGEGADVLDRLAKIPGYEKRADVLAALAECQCECHRFEEARNNFAIAAELEPARAAYWRGLAGAAIELHDYSRAEMAARRALSADGNDPLNLCTEGYVLEKLGRRQEAKSCYARAAKANPKDDLAKEMVASLSE